MSLGDQEDGKKKRYVGAGAIPERRKQRPRIPHNDGDLLEALFEQSLKLPSAEAKEVPQSITSMEPYIHADTLRKMLADKSCSIGDAWRFFVEHFGPEAWKRGLIDQRTSPRNIMRTKIALSKKIAEAKLLDPFSLDLPTVTEFSKVYSQMGMLHGQEWVAMMLSLLECLIKLDHSPPEDPTHKEEAIADVIGAWNVVFRLAVKAQDYPPEGSPYDWSRMPSISASYASQSFRRSGTQGLFAPFVPMFPIRCQHNIPAVAVTTFALLTKESIADLATVQDISPLISSLGTAISVHGFEVEKLAAAANISPTIREFLETSGPMIKEAASKIQKSLIENGAESKPLTESRSLSKFRSMSDSRSLSSTIQTDLSSISKRLYDALNRRDLPQVDKLWSDAAQFSVMKDLPTNEDGIFLKPKHGTLTAELCNYFILIYMSLRQPIRAIEVWNHMVKSGLPPDLKTWDAMMNGCKACKDAKALEDIWMKMLHLGVQPDVVCWTTRISGLIECHKVDKAMYALDEMGRLWLAANEREVGDPKPKAFKKKAASVLHPIKAVKPSIATINAAVAGLLRKRQNEAAHRVLAWASKFDIKPDVITFNTLLTPLIRDGHTKDAMALLKQMQKEGIGADVGTFTTILDETFRYSDELTPKEQKEITDNILSEMDAAGVKANLHTYGKMIYQLLQSMSGDLTVVNAVMEHMAKQGIQPTTYIYTMLVSHLFAQEPADLDAVKNLIERARMEVGSVDHIFWDRVIEGYARAGDTASAMRTLGKLESGGSHASWVTRKVLLTALAQNDDWATARAFVDNVKADTGGPKPDHQLKGKEGQLWFWRLAAELELL